MKYLDEYRDCETAKKIAAKIAASATQPWTIMEICGGQTHAIMRYGIQDLLPDGIELLHGPGCPVCVTPLGKIDAAIALARRPDVILCSFGDMLRVPGSATDLLTVRAQGADVRIVYSPLDALTVAAENPDRQIVFFAIGFETTAPPNAMAIFQAARQNLTNYSALVSQVLVPPAIEAILSHDEARVQAFLAAGHVCTITGSAEYLPIAARYHVPIAVTGFEPLDILDGILECVRQLEAGEATVRNCYARSARDDGNPTARSILETVFEPAAQTWRGIGEIPQSGLVLRAEYAQFDAEQRFGLNGGTVPEPAECIAGEVLQGRCKPTACTAFGTRCTPDSPLGAPMVSDEGACAAYYRFRRVAL